jgi:hypothetical protein
MPSVSKKQAHFMAAVAHNPAFAKKVGVPRSVGEEFSKADKGKTFKRGGEMKEKAKELKEAKTLEKLAKEERSEARGMKRGGGVKKMAAGGETMGPRTMKMDVEKGSNTKKPFGQHGIQKRGMTRALEETMPGSTTGMKKGGSIKKMATGGAVKFPIGEPMRAIKKGNRPHGEHAIQERGHTRAMQPKMKGRVI